MGACEMLNLALKIVKNLSQQLFKTNKWQYLITTFHSTMDQMHSYFVCRLCSPRCKKNNNKTIMNFGFQPFTCIQKWKHPERRQEPEFQISKEVTVRAPNWCILSFAIKYSSFLQYVALHPLTLQRLLRTGNIFHNFLFFKLCLSVMANSDEV